MALGNIKSPEALPALIAALDDDEALVRGHVAWALGRIGGIEAAAALRRRLEAEQDERVIGEIEDALSTLANDVL